LILYLAGLACSYGTAAFDKDQSAWAPSASYINVESEDLRFESLKKYQMIARIARTIFAVLVGLAVATLPATIGLAAGATSGTTTEISAFAAMPDCGHQHHNVPSENKQKTANDCACMAACALKGFSLAGVTFSGIVFASPASMALKLVRASNNVFAQMGSPPFRPPRS
jgi:hypothetical protein